MRIVLVAASLIVATTLAGCAGNQLSLDNASAKASAPPAPAIAMAGRWMLAAPNAPACGVHFKGAPGAREGAIQPEGGCPGDFFTSRHWTLDTGTLTINDHEDKPLAHLKLAGGAFGGQSTTGTPITLRRQLSPTGILCPNTNCIALPSRATPTVPR
jgi:hypothetical protein